jgi:hypothetical protein
MGDTFLKNLIGRQPDRILVSIRFEELVDLGVCEGGIGAQVAAQVPGIGATNAPLILLEPIAVQEAPVVAVQLEKAGVRLAWVLNRALR